MAFEEGLSGNHQNLSLATPTGSLPLPQYPEMIIAAIEALNDKNGSNKSAISRQIESTYGNLPPAHSTLLTHHLNRMKSIGQLVFSKNNYLKPDPNAPPRRGRGRPPKPKSPSSVGITSQQSSPRPRGRPPKSRDPSEPRPPPKQKPAPTTSSATVTGRKRGRPPKATSAVVPPPLAPVAVPVADQSGQRRGRGRPPKVKHAVTAPVGA
ncbi:hypothetical protein M569_01461 [Genlisea aurea]|uniref:HMG-Y-related protein A n=1 Tax=Genlisea aurea TaxID=192259 RepID=S8EBH9_9LAMI|nr:hypothetical protein M569_01461 [Genlisea aurea]